MSRSPGSVTSSASSSQRAACSACASPAPATVFPAPATRARSRELSSDREDLAAVVLAAGGACLVRGLELTAGAVRARRERGGGGLPLRTAGMGVGAGRLPLRD